MKDVSLVATAASVALLACAGSAAAVVQNRVLESTAVGLCQGALPAFETQIRKRPLAVQNEGASSTFVSCALTSQNSLQSVDVYFGSIGGTVTISCTGVTGFTGVAAFSSKSVTVGAGARAVISWTPSDFGATGTLPSALFSISCALPPGAAINDATVHFSEDVGD